MRAVVERQPVFDSSVFKKAFGIFTGSHMIFLSKCPGKVVDGIKSKDQSNLADGIFVFADHLAALFQLQLIDVFLRRLIQVFVEQNLKRGAGEGKFLADICDGQRFINCLIDIG